MPLPRAHRYIDLTAIPAPPPLFFQLSPFRERNKNTDSGKLVLEVGLAQPLAVSVRTFFAFAGKKRVTMAVCSRTA